jgi:hypothetical protein
MPYRSPWFVASFVVPLAALAACSAPADPAPFSSGSGAFGNAAQNAAASNPAASNPAAPSTATSSAASPAAAGSSASSEGSAALPLSPTDGAGSTPPAPAAPASPATPSQPPTSTNLDPTACASYDTGFLPLVHQPVCSGCHTPSGSLPRFEPFAQAERRCALIGQLVASGEMPPRGGLTAQQKAIVASWVALDCPETAADAALVCTPPANPAPGATPAPNPAPGATPPPSPVGDDDQDDDRGENDDDENDDD